MHDFVAATARSGPACNGSTVSAAAANGDVASLTSATTCAPAFRYAATVASRSGLRPDCEIAMHSAPDACTGDA